jgi:arylsulfatase A-like enzyme
MLMNRRAAAAACLVLPAAAGCASAEPAPAEAGGTPAARPNIIVVFTDDHGWADLGCQGAVPDVRTPRLDRLAREGVRMTAGYVTAPQCVPSRAGLLTGRYQQRCGVEDNTHGPLPLDETTLADRLRKAGYATGMVGKWHLEPNHSQEEWIRENLPDAGGAEGRRRDRARIPPEKAAPYAPGRRGFLDFFAGRSGAFSASFDLKGNDVDPAAGPVRTGLYSLDAQTGAALAFIRRRREGPFFLYLAYTAPHVPLEATPEYLARFPGAMPERRRCALAMLSAIDDGVDRMLDLLRELGIEERTLIFFTSDNGAPLKIDKKDLPLSDAKGAWDGSLNDPWVGEKGMLTEGGIRVPFLARWKGVLPEGRVFDRPVITLDIAATAAAAAGLPDRQGLDGVDLVPLLKGGGGEATERDLYWRFWNQAAVRSGRWKFLRLSTGERWLFDLESPEHERRNRIDEHPDMAGRLEERLKAWAGTLRRPGLPDGALTGAEKEYYGHYLGLK